MKSNGFRLRHRLQLLTAATGIFMLTYPAITIGTQLKPRDLTDFVALELVAGVAPGGGSFSATGDVLALSLASADLDEDGFADLVVGSVLEGNGVLTVYPGNRHAIYPNSKEPVLADTPFLKAIASIAAPATPEFLAAGDFTGDGHGDLITAAMGSGALVVFRGLGDGRFEDPMTVELGGRLTALTSGEIHRRDGVVDLVAAIDGSDGPSIVIFNDPRGALQGSAVRQSLPASAEQLVLGSFDDDPAHDLAVVAGSQLWVMYGSMWGGPSTIEAVSRTERVLAVADSGGRLGVLSENGDIALLAHSRSELEVTDGPVWQKTTIARVEKTKIDGGRWRLSSCRLSTAPTPDLLIHDLNTGRLLVVMTALPIDPPGDIVTLVAPVSRTVAELTAHSGSGPAEEYPVVLGSPSIAELDLDALAVAALPMRLSPDALDDLVFLPKSEAIPRILKSGSRATFTVSSTGDEEDAIIGDGICETAVLSCTLRAALSEANFAADLDTINFAIPAASDPGCDPASGICTIQVGAAGLATIVQPVVLDATTQSGFAGTPLIELDGSLTGANVTGFAIWGGGTTVRGFAINRFPNNSDILAWNLGNNIIEGNFLGTDPTGTVNVGSLNSLHISGITGTTIGGTAPEARNIISGNSGPAFAFNNGAFDNFAEGNTFGLDESGTIGLGNSGNDLLIVNGSTGNTIGGTTAGAGNTIAANQAPDFPSLGVAYDSSANLIQGSFVGTNFFGADLGNLGIAVAVVDSAANTIGGVVPGAGNVIAFNGSGIDLRGDVGIGNTITGNSIHSNDFLGIDLCADEDPVTGSCLDPDDVTPNDPADPDTGTNNLQNFPELVFVDRVAAGVDGTLDSIPLSTFTVDLYVNTNCDPTGYGEGETPAGSIPVTTDATGAVSFTIDLPTSPAAGTYLTATATDDGGSTSEFSLCLEIPPAADLSLGKFGFVSAVAPGDTLTYILDLTNNGPDDASGVVISDVLPLDAVFSAASPECTHAAGTVTCAVGELALNDSVSYSIDVVVGTPPGGEIINTATVSATEADPDPADNSATETTRVDASLIFVDGFEAGNTSAWSAVEP